jgi:hypothetical protein
MSENKEKRVQDVVPATVVSTDSTSPEQKLAVQAQTIQLQSSSDSHYDTVITHFSDMQGAGSDTSSMLSICVVVGLVLLSYLIVKRR